MTVDRNTLRRWEAQDGASGSLSSPEEGGGTGQRTSPPSESSADYMRGYLDGVQVGIDHGTQQMERLLKLLKGDV